jgi:hypothetical protein
VNAVGARYSLLVAGLGGLTVGLLGLLLLTRLPASVSDTPTTVKAR